MKTEYDIKITLKENIEEAADGEELRAALSYYNGKIYHVIEDNGRRTINGNGMTAGNTLEMDVTNMILLLLCKPSLPYNKSSYFDIEVIEKE